MGWRRPCDATMHITARDNEQAVNNVTSTMKHHVDNNAITRAVRWVMHESAALPGLYQSRSSSWELEISLVLISILWKNIRKNIWFRHLIIGYSLWKDGRNAKTTFIFNQYRSTSQLKPFNQRFEWYKISH